MVLPPLSLYVHLPWCVKKCPYCDFNSYSGGDENSRRKYLDALCADIAREARLAGTRRLDSVFFGGGTPSLFKPAEIGRLLDEVAGRFDLEDKVEITLEANPGTVECGDPRGYREAGINRLSLGAQSFDNRQLAALGRIHSADDIGRAFRAAREAGFGNINLDLMYCLPGQDVSSALADIGAAVALGPEHLSWYQLTLEPNTVFHARPPEGLPDEDLGAGIDEAGREFLAAHGYERYEISAFARPGLECRHNLNYWRFGDYLAAGAGAHGKLSGPEGVFRYSKPANPQQFMQWVGSGEQVPRREIGDSDRLFEFMLNASRLTDGIDETLFEERTGLPAEALTRRLEPLVESGLIARTGRRRWAPTATGCRFLNDLQAHFLP
jgi:oxygen-independent coproporphyrinogen-3 oxidase